MALSIQVNLPPGEEQKLLKILDPKRYQWAVKSAINRTSANVQRFTIKQIAKELGTTPSKIKRSGRAVLTSGSFGSVAKGRAATIRRPETSLIGTGRNFNVTRFNAIPLHGRREKGATTSGQIGVRHEAYNRDQSAMRTWMLVNKPGRPVVKRVDGLTKTKRAKLEGVYGPGVRWYMEQPKILLSMTRFTQRRFRHHWRSRLAYAMRSRGFPRGR